MLDELDELNEDRLVAFDQVQLNKRRVERTYNKHVRLKRFSEGDIIWKSILPLGEKDLELGKWSLNWEWPFIISHTLQNKAYQLVNSDGKELERSLNAKYLKKLYPSIWE